MGARIHAALSRSAQWAAIALGFSIPISVALDNILLALVAILWVALGAWGEKREALLANPVALAAVALFALLALGTLHGEREAGDAVSYLRRYADLLFVPVLAFLFRDRARRRHATLALAASLALILAISYLIAAGMPAARPLLGGPGNPVAFKHYLTHSVLMAFAAFLFFQLALAEPSGRRRWVWAAAGMAAAVNVLFMVQGRTGYLVLAVLAAYLGYAWLRWRGLALAGSVVAAVFAVLAVVPGTFQERLGLAAGEPQTAAGLEARASNAERLQMYRVTVAIIRDHPLLGVGTGGFPKAYAQRAPQDAVVPKSRNPHNEYLLIAAQVGLPGAALLLGLFLMHWLLASRLASPLEKHLARGLLLTIAVGCLFNSLLLDHTEGLLYAWLTGVLFGGLRPAPGAVPDGPGRHGAGL
ncbi:MAG TPA: O-antigen ligase family protein [Burkholderiales bacterium]|nr:O-antigen ligase family protein [Burkholderiales bacterium]